MSPVDVGTGRHLTKPTPRSLSPSPLQTEFVVSRLAVARVRDLVRLDDEPERVAAEEDENDGDQDHGRLLPSLPEVLRGAATSRRQLRRQMRWRRRRRTVTGGVGQD